MLLLELMVIIVQVRIILRTQPKPNENIPGHGYKKHRARNNIKYRIHRISNKSYPGRPVLKTKKTLDEVRPGVSESSPQGFGVDELHYCDYVAVLYYLAPRFTRGFDLGFGAVYE
jgi:hypothetical protein